MSSAVRPPLRRLLAPLLVALAMVGGLFALARPGTALSDDEAALAALVNGARAAAGLPPLVVSGALSDAARSHSAAMAASGSLSHSGGLASGDWTTTAENVGVGSSVTEIHAMLMGSGVHRANILGDFTQLGVGVVRGADGRLWATEVFVATATDAGPVPEPTTTTTTTTTVAPAVLSASVEATRPAPVARRAARARTDRAGARAAATGGECLPEQAEGQGYAYGRCDAVPRGASSAPQAADRRP